MAFDDAMQEVLKNARYDKLTGRSFDLRGLIEDALVRLIEWFINRFEFNLPSGASVNTNAVAFFFATAGGAVLLITLIIYIRNRQSRRRIIKTDLNDIFEEIEKKDWLASQWLALSQDYYIAGAYREAVRYCFIGGLVALNEKRLIKIQASKTNKQILNALTISAPGIVPYFSVLTDCFHRVWFGYKMLNEGEYERIFTETVAIAQCLKR